MTAQAGQLVEVRAAHRFDADALDRWLGGAVAGYAGPLAVRQFAGGQSNPTYLLQTPQAKYVLRRKPPGLLLRSAHAVDREFRVLQALWQAGFPVPQPLALCADEQTIGSMFYVMSHVQGRVFLDCTLPELSRAERAAVYDSVNATLARLHALDPAALGLTDFGRPGNYFARQVARWSEQYARSKTTHIPQMERLIEWLPAALPAQSRAALVHGDYSLHNILIHPREPRVVAVLDWELATIGDPLGDLMYHALEWYRPAGVDPRGTLAGHDLDALGIPALDDYLARYGARAGIAIPGDLAFYRAYNLFRVAAILQGIVGRARDGTAASADAAALAERVAPLAAAAWAEVGKG